MVRAGRASNAVPPSGAETLASLIICLAVTGMRIGEALRLDCCDIDWDQAVIKVRDTKFGRGRDVAVAASAAEALAAYRRHRDRRQPATYGCSCHSPAAGHLQRLRPRFRQAVPPRAREPTGRAGPGCTISGMLSRSGRCLAGTGPGWASSSCCRGCPPLWGTASRASPTAI